MTAIVKVTKPFVFEDDKINKKFILRPGRIVFGPQELKWKEAKRIMKKGFPYSYGFGPMYFEIPPEYLELTIR